MKKKYFILCFVLFFIFYVLNVIYIALLGLTFGYPRSTFNKIVYWSTNNPVNFLNRDWLLERILMNGLFWSVIFTLFLFLLYIFIRKLYNIL